MKKATKTATKKPETFPAGIVAKDPEYPKFTSGDKIAYNVGSSGRLTLMETDRMGWCVATLFISRGKRGQPDRTYGAKVDGGATVTIGNGPHVKRTLEVYIRESRVKALQSLIDTYTKGMANAGTIRDRIGSRRAQGALERASGSLSWRWDT